MQTSKSYPCPFSAVRAATPPTAAADFWDTFKVGNGTPSAQDQWAAFGHKPVANPTLTAPTIPGVEIPNGHPAVQGTASACPYLRGFHREVKSRQETDGEAALQQMLGQIKGATEEFQSKGFPLTYSNYILPDVLDAMIKLNTDSPHEHMFVRTHQGQEVHFNIAIYCIKTAIATLMDKSRSGDFEKLFDVTRLLDRTKTAINVAQHGFDIMETMMWNEFLQFRGGLGSGSGFQSSQFRQLEALIGVVPESRAYLAARENSISHMPKFLDDLDPTEASLVQQLQNGPTLASGLTHWLAQLYPSVAARADPLVAILASSPESKSFFDGDSQYRNSHLLSVFSQAPGHTVVVEGETCAPWSVEFAQPSTSTQARLQITYSAETDRWYVWRFWYGPSGTKTGPGQSFSFDTLQAAQAHFHELYSILSFGSTFQLSPSWKVPAEERQVVAKARATAAFLLAHFSQPTWAYYAAILRSAIELEREFVLWRQRHARMVEAMMGRRSGTAGSSGVAYLDDTAHYRSLPDLWYLINIGKSADDLLKAGYEVRQWSLRRSWAA